MLAKSNYINIWKFHIWFRIYSNVKFGVVGQVVDFAKWWSQHVEGQLPTELSCLANLNFKKSTFTILNFSSPIRTSSQEVWVPPAISIVAGAGGPVVGSCSTSQRETQLRLHALKEPSWAGVLEKRLEDIWITMLIHLYHYLSICNKFKLSKIRKEE